MTLLRFDPIGRILLTLGIAGALAGTVHAQNAPNLVAPVYPGATSPTPCVSKGGRCVFATRDTLDKVKAFYDTSVQGLKPLDKSDQGDTVGGSSQALKGYVVVLQGQEAGEGDVEFAGLRIFGYAPVVMPPATDPKAGEAAGHLKYLRVMANGTAWPIAGRPWTPEEMKMSGVRPPEEFYKVFQQYRHLESAFYPQDKADEAKKRYDDKTAAIREKYQQAGEKQGRQTQSDFKQLMKDNQRQQQDAQRQREEDCKRGPTAQQKADHEEVKRIIKKNSAERYNRFIAVTAKMEKYQKEHGCAPPPVTRDSPAMQNAMEMGQILQEDKEAMAFLEKVNKRDEASRPKNTGAEAFQRNVQGNQALLPQAANETWQAGLEYLAALDKIYYRTQITIDPKLTGKGVITDRAKIAALLKEERRQNAEAGGDTPAQSGGKSAGASAPAPASGAATPGAKPGQTAKEPEKKDDTTEGLKKAGSEGFKMIKKLF